MKYGIALVALLAVAGPVLFERHTGAVLDAVETGAGGSNRSILASSEKERGSVAGWKDAAFAALEMAEKQQALYEREYLSRVAADRVHARCLENGVRRFTGPAL